MSLPLPLLFLYMQPKNLLSPLLWYDVFFSFPSLSFFENYSIKICLDLISMVTFLKTRGRWNQVQSFVTIEIIGWLASINISLVLVVFKLNRRLLQLARLLNINNLEIEVDATALIYLMTIILFSPLWLMTAECECSNNLSLLNLCSVFFEKGNQCIDAQTRLGTNF